jgi:phosphomannomutase
MAEDVPVRFGTSSLRGSAHYLNASFVDAHVSAFLTQVCGFASSAGANAERHVFLAMDRRSSSAAIAARVKASVERLGAKVRFFGHVPTPALAAYGFAEGHPAIMVTASHNPAPHNGLKFFTATGELLHDEQARMLQALPSPLPHVPDADPNSLPEPDPAARNAYIERYLSAFDRDALSGLSIALDVHSSAGRDLLQPILEGLGASCQIIRQTDDFVAIDTENVPADTLALYRNAAASQDFDAILSTDGDGDRPLLTDETGHPVHGDQLGLLAARGLAADTVITPVSTTTSLELSGWFDRVERTRIGSPHIIAALHALGPGAQRAVAFEANGGFVLAHHAKQPHHRIEALPTRDAMLPMLVVLVDAARERVKLSELKATLPQRFVASGSIIGVPTDVSRLLIGRLIQDDEARNAFAADIAPISEISTVDGLRLIGDDLQIIHLRPSGNAPELRIYVETDSDMNSEALLSKTRRRLQQLLSDQVS